MQYRKYRFEEIFKPDQKHTQELNKLIIEKYQDIKDKYGETDINTINAKKALYFILKDNDATDDYPNELPIFNEEMGSK